MSVLTMASQGVSATAVQGEFPGAPGPNLDSMGSFDCVGSFASE